VAPFQLLSKPRSILKDNSPRTSQRNTSVLTQTNAVHLNDSLRNVSLQQKGQRAALLLELEGLEAEAQQAAAQGDLGKAGRGILKILDCERRVSGLGPQVLQLIKPRS